MISHHPLKGFLLIASGSLLFACLDATTKYLTAYYQVPVIAAMRYFVHLVLMAAILMPKQSNQQLFGSQRKGLVILRALTLVLASLFIGLALKRMPLAETIAINFSAPILVVLLAGTLLGERVGILGWIAVIMGFIGVLLVARPGGNLDGLGILFAFMAATCGAIYQLLSRMLASTEKSITLLFYSAIVGSIFFGIAFPWFWENRHPTYLELSLFVFMGAAGGLGHYFFTMAYRHAPASLLAPVTYIQLVWAGLLGWFLFDNTPHGLSILGMSIVAASGLLIALKSRFG